jgi:hypothetical protein
MAVQQSTSPSNTGATSTASATSMSLNDTKISSPKAMDGKLKDDEAYNDSGNSPTYQSSKMSVAYAQAKYDLENGDFDAALSVIEGELTKTMEQVGSHDFHAALAPLYYMYGTTLLYSVEESAQDAMAMTVPQGDDSSSHPEQAEVSAVEVVNDNADEEEEAATMAVNGDNEGEENPVAPPATLVDTSAEDLQIAWENLEMSRSILDKLLDPCTAGGSDYDSLSADETEMARDLAQIHLRLGDLQKSNGNYNSSTEDYERCRAILESVADPCAVIICATATKADTNKVFADRKVANVHYSLAMTYMLLAAEGEKESNKEAANVPQQTSDNPILAAMAAAAKTAEDDKPRMTTAEISYYREQSIQHYLQTGKCFAALMANLCGETPDLGGGESSDENAAAAASSAVVAISTSLSELIFQSSKQLTSIRTYVASWEALLDNDKDAVADWKELLDEIQETIDSAESEAQVLRENVNNMTSDVEQQVKDEDARGAAGSTTTIGFGAPNASTVAAVANAPMLVVKKKKRAPAPVTDSSDGNKKTKASE